MLTILVIDTSYLLELYRVPDYFDPAAHDAIKAKFAEAITAKSRLYVPFPAIFEVANHIVDGRDGTARKALAARFVGDIVRSFEKGTPYTVTPAIDEEKLKALLLVFAKEFAPQRVGLTDAAIVDAARRLKTEQRAPAKVYIWTKDRRLKANEPDPEPNPFVV